MLVKQQSYKHSTKRTLSNITEKLLPIGTGIVILVAWYLATKSGDVPKYVLPSPTNFLNALERGFITFPPSSSGSYLFHYGRTLLSAVIGFVVGSSLGILMGSFIAEDPIIEKGIMPFFYALQGLPKLALAPLIMNWFGFGFLSVVIVSCMGTYFPLLTNSVTALTSTERELLDVMRALGATRWQTYWKVKFPSSLPIVFAGLRMSVVYCVIGALLAEFVGSSRGMGYLILQQQAVLNTAGLFGSLLILAITSTLLGALVHLAERRLLFWTRTENIAVVG
jgi:NitT/TauT family transport system permease protein